MTTVKDPVLEPYYCTRDNHGWAIHEVVTPQAQYLEEGSEGKDYIKTISYPATFGSCLKKVAELKAHTGNTYNSIREYLDLYKNIHKEIEEKFNVSI